MFNSTNPGVQRLIGALGFIALLFAIGILLTQQGSVQLAYATQPAFRGALGPEGIALPLAIDGNSGAEPWTGSQVEQPAELAREVLDPKSKKPLIIYVGFPFLHQNAHIPGALFRGTAGKPEGLEELKKWAQNIARSQSIVVYCGCCPWNRCPNIRPAFKTLQEMGFTRLKVLFLQTDFSTDWLQKGFPVERGK